MHKIWHVFSKKSVLKTTLCDKHTFDTCNRFLQYTKYQAVSLAHFVPQVCIFVGVSSETEDMAGLDELTRTMLLLLAVLTVKMENIYGARILLASPQVSSHVIMQTGIGEELVRRGHEVYIVIASRYHKPESLAQRGLRPVVYHMPPDVPFGMGDDMAKRVMEHIFSPDFDLIQAAVTASAVVFRDCKFMLSDNKFMQQVRSLKFDIALVEAFVLSPCNLLLPYNLSVPFVSLTTSSMAWNIRMPVLPSFFHISLPGQDIGSEPSGFWSSLINTMTFFSFRKISSAIWNSTLLEHYSSRPVTWDELILKSQLFFIPLDHHLDSPLPLFPNIIPVPGITVRPTKPLTGKLEELITESRQGVILVTFGSVASYFPESVIVKFLEAFSRVEQTVIARLTMSEGVVVPKNVHVFQWLPQNDILSHEYTKLFITHGGSNGQHEALYHGVPMLGFPLFAEQSLNCQRARAKGFGLTMNIHNFTSEELFDNIREMLNNNTYSDTVKRSSAILRDEPLFGPEKAAHWIEHVVKYGSAHLRSPAMDLPLYRFLMLDVVAIFFIVTSVVIAITCLSTVAVAKIIRRKWLYPPSQKKTQ